MKHKKLLLMTIGFGLVFFYSPEATLAQANQSTLTVGMPSTSRISTPVTSVGEGVTIRRGTGFQTEIVGGGDILIPQDVYETILTRTATGNPNKTSEKILICLTDSCGFGNSSGSSSINLNELATLVESDLNQAFSDLVAAQQAASEGTVAADNSRQIVRKESDAANCGCIPGETKIIRELTHSEYSSNTRRNLMSVTEARQIVETKLEESSIFVEQINQLNPENSLW